MAAKDKDKKSSDEHVVDTKVFPIKRYQVSQEWISNLYLQLKKTVLSKAIETDCPKEFLASVNALELNYTDEAQISLVFTNQEEPEEVVVSEGLPSENPASQQTAPQEEPAAAEQAPPAEGEAAPAAEEAAAEEPAAEEPAAAEAPAEG